MPSERPLSAIIGDATKANSPELASGAAEEFGADLANRGFEILVFSSAPDFLGGEVVKDYLASKAKQRNNSSNLRHDERAAGNVTH